MQCSLNTQKSFKIYELGAKGLYSGMLNGFVFRSYVETFSRKDDVNS